MTSIGSAAQIILFSGSAHLSSAYNCEQFPRYDPNVAKSAPRFSTEGQSMNVVITGSTKGIGLGMAREFLQRGHKVVISSRGQQAVDDAVAKLSADFPADHVAGQTCDVSDYNQVQQLWNACVMTFGRVDIWVNNAGRDSAKEPFYKLPPEDYTATVQTNLLGIMHCNRVAIAEMKQQGGGQIFNMEGFGSDGRTMAKYAPYGATKYAVKYFTKVMVEECKGTTVEVCYLSPGMVLTELLISPGWENDPEWPKRRRFFNIVADTVETVTPWLVEGMLNAKGNGAAVRWITGPKIMLRFLKAVFVKRDIMTPMGY
jgi:NAD(P)-dependent dehydrogenase (short-subunit alcohol dehydrogenase family)